VVTPDPFVDSLAQPVIRRGCLDTTESSNGRVKLREGANKPDAAAQATPDEVKIGYLSELEPHGQFSRWSHGHDVLVYRYQGELKAISNICRHFGGPIGYHQMKDGVFTCLWHCYQFSAADGACLTKPKLAARQYKVWTEGDSSIWVQLVEKS
jgi:nitrite reductase/ring-hydroxylating ferredoxin subunit